MILHRNRFKFAMWKWMLNIVNDIEGTGVFYMRMNVLGFDTWE